MEKKVTLFNRKELLITYDGKRQAQVRNVLNANKVDYQVKVVNRNSSSPLGGAQRGKVGTLGENLELEYEYIIYVPKEDYQRAQQLIQ